MVGFVVVDAGRSAIVVVPVEGGPPRPVTAEPQPRPGRGLGGGCWDWTPDGTTVVYVAVDGDLWARRIDGTSLRRLTDMAGTGPLQAPSVAPDGSAVAYAVDTASIWRVDLTDRATSRVDGGSHGFCADPSWSPDASSLSWQAWSVPDMPWDESVVVTRHHDGSVTIWAPGAQAQQPRWTPDGAQIVVTDRSGWANVEVLAAHDGDAHDGAAHDGAAHGGSDDVALPAEPFEHAGPSWGMGQRSFAVSPDGRFVVHTRNERGFGRLVVVDRATGARRELARGVHGQLSWRGDHVAAIRTGARTPTQVVAYRMPARGLLGDAAVERRILMVASDDDWDDADLVEPELVEVTSDDGVTLHARLHRADPADRADQRLICWLHGGPTDQWQVTFMPRVAYWRSRGWSVLVPDHRGSTGHGRDHQQALHGWWGVVDVRDTIAAVHHAHAMGWGRPERTVLIGASAGGFTVLGAIVAAPQVAAAAVVLYPVTDLVDLAQRSHRFERHYTHHLVGPLPSHEATYLERSPVEHAGRIRTPLLVLHGDADPVVPLEQSERLVTRARDAGGDVTLHVYPGEGHGWRQPEHQRDEYERIATFLARTVGPERWGQDRGPRTVVGPER